MRKSLFSLIVFIYFFIYFFIQSTRRCLYRPRVYSACWMDELMSKRKSSKLHALQQTVTFVVKNSIFSCNNNTLNSATLLIAQLALNKCTYNWSKAFHRWGASGGRAFGGSTDWHATETGPISTYNDCNTCAAMWNELMLAPSIVAEWIFALRCDHRDCGYYKAFNHSRQYL